MKVCVARSKNCVRAKDTACLGSRDGESRFSVEGAAQVVIAGHAFMQNLRRGHYDLALDTSGATRLAAAFADLARII
jgi:hypothetical protein